jgi:hypothetical protein
MEETSNLTFSAANTENPHLTKESASFLLKAAKWGKFLAILGFIVTGLMIIAGVLMSFVLNLLKDETVPVDMPLPPALLSLLYIIIAGIYLVPVFYLNSFCNNAIKAVNLSSTEHLTISIRNLKNLFVFVGISTIVVLALYSIILIIIGSAAMLSL